MQLNTYRKSKPAFQLPKVIQSHYTVESLLKDCLSSQKNMVSQERRFLVTGSFTLKCLNFCQKLVVFRDVVSQDRFHCNNTSSLHEVIPRSKYFYWKGHSVELLEYMCFMGREIQNCLVILRLHVRVKNARAQNLFESSLHSIWNFFTTI